MSNLSRNLAESSQHNINRMIILGVGDFIVFLLFVLIGGTNHGDTGTDFIRVFAQTGLPFVVAWGVLGALLKMFQINRFGSIGATALRTLLVWLPAGVVGLVLRSLILGRAIVPTFALVALVTMGALLVIWRVLFVRFLAR